MSLAEQLKELRHMKAVTIREVEKATGVSNAYLSQIENGKIPSPPVLRTLADYYGTSYVELMELAGYIEPREVLGDENVDHTTIKEKLKRIEQDIKAVRDML